MLKEKQEQINIADTIVAVATPSGEGGISVVRISGINAKKIGFSLVNKKDEIIPNLLKLATLDTGLIKDEVMIVYFKAPNSYTGEDVVEIQCHGNNFITENIVKTLIERGSRIAENGEFTKRAFLNNKIDLTKAEGIIDIINAKTTAQINAANDMMNGEIYKKIALIQNLIISLTAKAEVSVDYPEEDLEYITVKEIEKSLLDIIEDLTKLSSSFNEGKLIREGVKVALVGEPNVGKSQLMNALLNQNRAIVTDIKGTTRDTLEESYSYKNIRFNIVDTAGIRETDDVIERLGINRSLEALNSCDILLAISEADRDFPKNLEKDKPIIYVKNKIDKIKVFSENSNKNVVYISALKNENINLLKDMIYDLSYGKVASGGVCLQNTRQYNATLTALNALLRAKESIGVLTLDCIISDLNEAYRSLGTITGLYATSEIVNEIFARFCVGK